MPFTNNYIADSWETYIDRQLQCMGSFKSPDRGSGDWTYGLTFLSEKMRKSNHLQMLEQTQHLLLNYFKNLSVGPARNRTQVSRTVDWYLTNYRLTRRLNTQLNIKKPWKPGILTKFEVIENRFDLYRILLPIASWWNPQRV